MDSITKRINSPEYRRDMELPSELQGKATVIDNDDWQATKQKLDAFYLQGQKANFGRLNAPLNMLM